MAAESFFARWSKRKTEDEAAPPVAGEHADATAPVVSPSADPQRVPTIEDVARLTPESDYSPFVARGVDEQVKRSALKKLFADPHFNVMDGLDVYIEDYNSFTPIPPEMLAALNHAKDLLNPQFGNPLLRAPEEPEDASAPADAAPNMQPEMQPEAAADCGKDAAPDMQAHTATPSPTPDRSDFGESSR
ncbi:DUF3306 domain-containing protein [Noviherbaspirillum cavernae]|uniref:DUF3306 domain-containing protein n=1 Tax=Noviherbaspirillum cavernae TaxID=2320862 RepID=A0A418X4P5_9BURK|nr:DUF3306 domain-containing protein [Noviherbaspirillum cavernae]RJG07453.1 DUF3306 domain-containing protein [Noviherbaspirillum cavernae]